MLPLKVSDLLVSGGEEDRRELEGEKNPVIFIDKTFITQVIQHPAWFVGDTVEG